VLIGDAFSIEESLDWSLEARVKRWVEFEDQKELWGPFLGQLHARGLAFDLSEIIVSTSSKTRSTMSIRTACRSAAGSRQVRTLLAL
jgi:hypothetical protein